MTKLQMFWHLGSTVVIVALAAWWTVDQATSSDASSEYPNRPIHVVVPYAAGGGSDTFVRIVQKGIVQDNLLGQPMVIINQAGGIGTIGSREVKNAEPDGYKILCHHNAIITAKLTDTVDYGPEAFEPIALTGEMSMVILVRDDSPITGLADLLKRAAQRPKEIRFAANKGAPAYFATLQLERAWPGATFSIVSSGGGADRYAKILGGHLEAGIFSLSEYLDFRAAEGTPPDQNIRAIAVLGQQRHDSIPDVPTAAEAGVPVFLNNANYWWAPKGTPARVIDRLSAVLESAMRNETVRAELNRIRMDPTFDDGESLRRRLNDTVRQFEGVVAQKTTTLPNFTLYVVVVVSLLAGWVILESWFGSKAEIQDPLGDAATFRKRPGLAIAALVVLCAYVWLLGQGWIPFAFASAAMVLAVGGLMVRVDRGSWPVLMELALLTGLGAQFVFSKVFVTPLP